MAKRTRYQSRPATRRPAGRPSGGSSAATAPGRSGGLSDAELERAAALEAELVAREKAAIADNARRRARAAHASPEAAPVTFDPNQPLSVRAAHEYAYVARDVRRIVVTAALMLAILAAIWIAVNASSLFG